MSAYRSGACSKLDLVKQKTARIFGRGRQKAEGKGLFTAYRLAEEYWNGISKVK
jgi:hypothetical protein